LGSGSTLFYSRHGKRKKAPDSDDDASAADD